MNKKLITIILVILVLIGTISLYSTFAYNEENFHLDESNADYNLVYSLQEKSKKEIILLKGEEKYVNITLTNTYDRNVKYGIYYYVLGNIDNSKYIEVTKSADSLDLVEDVIKPNETKSISLKIKNTGTKDVNLVTGALIGYEKGKIEDLVKKGEILVKK